MRLPNMKGVWLLEDALNALNVFKLARLVPGRPDPGGFKLRKSCKSKSSGHSSCLEYVVHVTNFSAKLAEGVLSIITILTPLL